MNNPGRSMLSAGTDEGLDEAEPKERTHARHEVLRRAHRQPAVDSASTAAVASADVTCPSPPGNPATNRSHRPRNRGPGQRPLREQAAPERAPVGASVRDGADRIVRVPGEPPRATPERSHRATGRVAVSHSTREGSQAGPSHPASLTRFTKSGADQPFH